MTRVEAFTTEPYVAPGNREAWIAILKRLSSQGLPPQSTGLKGLVGRCGHALSQWVHGSDNRALALGPDIIADFLELGHLPDWNPSLRRFDREVVSRWVAAALSPDRIAIKGTPSENAAEIILANLGRFLLSPEGQDIKAWMNDRQLRGDSWNAIWPGLRWAFLRSQSQLTSRGGR